MPVIKLDQSHKEAIKQLFNYKTYMGNQVSQEFNEMLYDRFYNTYLFGLNSFHCYGYEDSGEIKAIITFYESDEEPAWYDTLYVSLGDTNLLREVLDTVIKHNENKGRLKFYTLINANNSQLLRSSHWSKYNDERYDYFDECIVPAKNKSLYVNHWELLFKNTLLPEDTIVRCNFLKQEYRTTLPLGGNL